MFGKQNFFATTGEKIEEIKKARPFKPDFFCSGSFSNFQIEKLKN